MRAVEESEGGDPRAAQADDEGAWLPIGDVAYPRFDPRPVGEGGVVGAPPGGVTDRRMRSEWGQILQASPPSWPLRSERNNSPSEARLGNDH